MKFDGTELPLIYSDKINLIVYPEEVDYFGGNSPYITGGNDTDAPTKIIMPSVIHNIRNGYLSFPTMEEIILPGGDYSNVSVMFTGCSNLKKITITGEITGMQGQFFATVGSSLKDIYYYGSEESLQRVEEAWEAMYPDGASTDAFMGATIHYMTGNPPTREDLLKEYGVADNIYGLYSDEAYAEVVAEKEVNKTTMFSSKNPIAMLQQDKLNNFVSQQANVIEEHIHTLSIDEKAPTCTEDGYYKVTCSTCGEILADHVCHKLGHNMKMIDPGDNTTGIIVHKYQCTRCQYTESSDHEHNWIVKGYENMTYPDGGDEISICTICLTKRTDHADSIPGLYTEEGLLMYSYDDLEDNFEWNLSITPVKNLMDAHTELENGRILLLPSWQYLSEVATESGADCGLIRGGTNVNPCFTGSLLSEVILPNDCDDFGDWFCSSNVTRIELPDSITNYKKYSISGASKLKYLKLSAGATDLSNFGGAHGNNELETIIFPEGIKTLGNSLFAANEKLKNVTLPNSLTDMGCTPFASTGVEYLEIPGGVKNIYGISDKNNTLIGMSKLREIVFQNGVEYFGENVFGYLTNLEKIKLPDTIKVIPASTFWNASKIKLIILPEEVESMGGSGFLSCGENSDELRIIMPNVIKKWENGESLVSSKLKEIVLPGETNYPEKFVHASCGLTKIVMSGVPYSIHATAFQNLHDADIYYYGSRESLEALNATAGIDDVFYQAENNNTVHFMIGTPPSREDQMNGIDYSSLIEDTGATTLSIPVSVSDVSSGNITTVSDGNAN